MHRRTFLHGLFGVAGAAIGASIATRAEALTPARTTVPKPQGPAEPAAAEKDALSGKLAGDAEIETVGYRRRYYRRPYYRPRYRRWRPVRRRVCRTTRNRWGRVKRVCYFR